MEEKTILTEEQLQEVSGTAEDAVKDNEKISKMREIENSDHVETGYADVESGIMGDDGLSFDDDKFANVDLYEAAIDDMKKDPIYATKLTEEVAEKMNVPVTDMVALFNIANRYRKKENFSIYNALPDSIKTIINTQIFQAGITPDNKSRALYCDLFIDQFISEFIDKKLDQEIVDFNKSIQETLGSITNITDMYAGHIRYMMEVELIKKAEEAENETAKKIYLDCSHAFTDSYKFTRMLDLIAAGGKIRRKLYKENFKFDSICRGLDYRNKDTKFSIRNIGQMYDGLLKYVAPELNLDENDCKAFVILFIKTTDGLDMNNIVDSLYVYYSIFNIVNLGFDTSKSKFYHVILNNIKKVFNAMWDSNSGNLRVRFEIDGDIDWTKDDLLSEDDIKSFEASLAEESK